MLDVSHGRLLLPLGPPGEDRYILLGHLPSHALIRRYCFSGSPAIVCWATSSTAHVVKTAGKH
jgi:hypothetical protein